MFRFLVLFSAAALGGCVNGYQQYYRPIPNTTPDLIAKVRVAPPPATPMAEHVPAFSDAVMEGYEKQGYVVIGYSSFNSGNTEPDRLAIKQGQVVGADLVLISDPKYTGSESTAVPITTPTSSTSFSSGTATAVGPLGPVTAFSTGTSTSYGSQTSFIPVTIHRQDYGALYLIKRHYVLGLMMRDLNDEERKAIQSNKGAFVRIVVNNTPAFNADILPGDIITAANGTPVATSGDLSNILASRAGQHVTISILRGTQRLQKDVLLSQ